MRKHWQAAALVLRATERGTRRTDGAWGLLTTAARQAAEQLLLGVGLSCGSRLQVLSLGACCSLPYQVLLPFIRAICSAPTSHSTLKLAGAQRLRRICEHTSNFGLGGLGVRQEHNFSLLEIDLATSRQRVELRLRYQQLQLLLCFGSQRLCPAHAP